MSSSSNFEVCNGQMILRLRKTRLYEREVQAWLFLSALPYVSPWHDYPGMKVKNSAVECCTLCERVVSFEDFE